jgi:GTP-binding protein HflX
MPTAMSRLTGGIGGRGPGETKLEINRRRADERLTLIERSLKDISAQRKMRRDRRKRVGLPLVAIVGYTNAGKSTLLNRMTRSAVDAEDKLFATLDPTSRRLRFPQMREIILTDTVGFIKNLPKDLVHAFRSTLDEALDADLLLHVVNASEPDVVGQKEAVDKVLAELDAADTPTLVVLNQVDRADADEVAARVAEWDASAVSAVTGEGLDRLLERIERAIFRERAAAEWARAQEERAPDDEDAAALATAALER